MTAGIAEETSAELKPGDRMKDGTIFAGISPDTNKPMYTTPADARNRRWFGLAAPEISFTFARAQRHAARLDACGHQDWRVPSKDELNVLFNNRTAIGAFDLAGPEPAGWYWSRTKFFKFLEVQYFGHGGLGRFDKKNFACLRCVRG